MKVPGVTRTGRGREGASHYDLRPGGRLLNESVNSVKVSRRNILWSERRPKDNTGDILHSSEV